MKYKTVVFFSGTDLFLHRAVEEELLNSRVLKTLIFFHRCSTYIQSLVSL